MTFDDVRESAAMAVDTIRANKLRSSLTILGVSVGVITVIFMVSIIQGLNRAFADQIEGLGSNAIWVTKFDASFGKPPSGEQIHRKNLTIEDADAILNEAPSIADVTPLGRKISTSVRYADKQSDTPILFGTNSHYELRPVANGTRT
jgi:putative ABC transport system permease protein